MIKYLLILLFFSSSSIHLFAIEDNTDSEENVFKSTYPEFSSSIVPEKWNKESAVVLAQATTFTFKFKNELSYSQIEIHERVRKRIKLLDKRAVEEFSLFYFSVNSPEKYIHVIKPNGKELSTDMSQLITVDAVVGKEKIKHLYRGTYSYQKIAVPNIEVGDIIDYYYHLKIDVNTGGSAELMFEEITMKMQGDLPIVFQCCKINLLSKFFYFKYRALNEAPALRVLKGREEQNSNKFIDAAFGSSNKLDQLFYFESRDNNKFLNESFSFIERDAPIIKFRVLYTSNPKSLSIKDHFFQTQNTPLESIVKVDIIKERIYENLMSQEKTFKSLNMTVYADYIREDKPVLNAMDKYHPNVEYIEQYLPYAYYIFRSQIFNRFTSQYNPITKTYEKIELNEPLSDIWFFLVWKKICESLKLKIELGVGLPNRFKSFEEISSIDDLELFPIIEGYSIYNFTRDSHFSSKRIELIGGKRYKFVYGEKEAPKEFIDLPAEVTSPSENKIHHYKNIAFQLSELKCNVVDTFVISGFCKQEYSSIVLNCAEIWKEDSKISGLPYQAEDLNADSQRSGTNVKRQQERERLTKEKNEEVLENKLSKIKYLVQEEGIKAPDVDDFNLIKDGRSEKNSELEFVVSYKISDYLTKIGNNYLFKIGKLMKPLLEMTDVEDRNNNMYFPYPASTSSYTFSILIPKDYIFSGLDKMVMKKENEYFSFTSNFTQENNVLTVDVSMTYKVAYIEKENCRELISFIQEIQNVYDVTLLLKKK